MASPWGLDFSHMAAERVYLEREHLESKQSKRTRRSCMAFYDLALEVT